MAAPRECCHERFDLVIGGADAPDLVAFPIVARMPRVDDRRVIRGIVFVIRNSLALAGGAQGLWPAQDDLQSPYPLGPARRVQPYIRGAGGQGWQA